MLAISTLIDFLLGLMRDDEAKVAFEADPQGTLFTHGLRGLTGDDVRDARLIMADRGDIQSTGHAFSGPRHADPVREIHHTTKNFEVRDIDQTLNVVNIDDRDTLIDDSFNSNDNNDVDVVAIQDNDQIVVEKEEPEPEPDVFIEEPVVTEPVEEPVLPDDPVDVEPDLDAAII